MTIGVLWHHCCLLRSNSKYATRKPILNDFMKALADPNTHIIGLYGSDDEHRQIPEIRRRIDRDKVFDVILTVAVTKNPDVNKIQDKIAAQLRFKFSKKTESEGERASEVINRIREEKRILIILLDLYKGLDLGKIGIPFGGGCKILVTSSNAGMIVSNQMHTDRDFYV